MKKLFLTSLFILASVNLKAETFENLANKLTDRTYDKEFNIIRKDKIGKNLLDFNNLSLSFSLDHGGKISNNGSNDNTLKLNGNLKYSILTYNFSYDLIKSNTYTHSIGLSKNLNSLMYNRFKENDIDYRLRLRELNDRYEKDLLYKINLIKKYLLLNYESSILDADLKNLDKELKVLKVKKNNGQISEFDYSVASDNISVLIEKLNLVNLNLEAVKLELKINDIDFSLINELEKFDKINISNEELEKYIQKKFLNSEMLDIQKMKIDNTKNILNQVPQINVSFNYDIDKKTYSASLNLLKNLDIVNTDIDNIILKRDLINKKINKLSYLKEKKFNEINLEIKNFEIDIKEKELKLKNLDKEILILNKKYELGLDGLNNLYKKRNELMQLKIELNNKKLDYEIFKFIIKRGAK